MIMKSRKQILNIEDRVVYYLLGIKNTIPIIANVIKHKLNTLPSKKVREGPEDES